MKKNNIFMT